MAAVSQLIRLTYLIIISMFLGFALSSCAPKKEGGAQPSPVFGIKIDENKSLYRALGDDEESEEEDCEETITLAWDANPETNIAGYNVQVTNTDTGETHEIDAGNSTSVDIDLPPGNYSITATAYDTNGLESEPSNPPVTITIDPCEPEEPDHDDDGDGTNVDTDDPVLDPTNNTLSATYTSGDDICPGQAFAVETSTDLQNWNQTGDVLITPFEEEVSVDTGGAPNFFMRLRPLNEPLQVQPCGSSSSNSESSESSESTSSYASSDSSSSDWSSTTSSESSYPTSSSESSSSDSSATTSSEQSSSDWSATSSSEQPSSSSSEYYYTSSSSYSEESTSSSTTSAIPLEEYYSSSSYSNASACIEAMGPYHASYCY